MHFRRNEHTDVQRCQASSCTSIFLLTPACDPSCYMWHQILSLEMHRGLRPLGASPLGGVTGDSSEAAGKGMEGSRAAAKAVEAFVRNNIEKYFGIWADTYSRFSLNPRLVCVFCLFFSYGVLHVLWCDK